MTIRFRIALFVIKAIALVIWFFQLSFVALNSHELYMIGWVIGTALIVSFVLPHMAREIIFINKFFED